VAGTEALLFFVVVPVLAWAAELLVIRGAYEATARDLASRSLSVPTNRVYVVLSYGAVSVFLGLALWALSIPLTGQIDAGTGPGFSHAQSLLIWTAVAYGTAAIVTAAARALMLRARFGALMGHDFGRILPLSVIPHTGTVYALVLGFLVLGAIENYVSGAATLAQANVDGAVASLQAYAIATLGFLAGALASNRIQDLSLRGYQRALLFVAVGELPAVLGLVWAFLAIGKL